ncbi:MAG: hypothetical protein VKK59_05525 [Vampirovibrionales bacterium]|nr:hypothetical protein [Vampirovibrionales bacterium]
MLFPKKVEGQATIEYAGAIVVTAAIVGALLAFGPDNFSAMFNNIIQTISSNVTDHSAAETG